MERKTFQIIVQVFFLIVTAILLWYVFFSEYFSSSFADWQHELCQRCGYEEMTDIQIPTGNFKAECDNEFIINVQTLPPKCPFDKWGERDCPWHGGKRNHMVICEEEAG